MIASKWTPAGIGHPRGDRRRTGASFEQGGVGTSVFRAFLLLAWAPPILDAMARKPRSRSEEERKLDEALEESFPASDPVSVGHNDHPGSPASPPVDNEGRETSSR